MSLIRTFDTRGRRVAWFALLLGGGLVADAAWTVSAEHYGAAMVVGSIGLERLIHAATHGWYSRTWPWRIRSMELDSEGLQFEEANAYGDDVRQTTLGAGLILEASVEPGSKRGADADWVVVVYTILGTVVWSAHDDRSDAEATATALQQTLDARTEAHLDPPRHTGALDIMPSRHAVMWGKPPVVPIVTVSRCVLLLAAIFTLPALVEQQAWVFAAWMLVAFTTALLAFPFVGAVSVLMQRAKLVGVGASIQQGELRAFEQSTPSHSVPLERVRHIGFGDLAPSGDVLAMRLVAHTEPNTPVESWVATSWFVQMANEAYRLVAESYDVDGPTMERSRWTVRLPGGIAEAIEAVSWMQRFVAENRADEE